MFACWSYPSIVSNYPADLNTYRYTRKGTHSSTVGADESHPICVNRHPTNQALSVQHGRAAA